MAATEQLIIQSEVRTRRGDRIRLPRRPLSRVRIDRIVTLLVAIFGLAFGAQTLPVIFGQLPALKPNLGLYAPLVLYATFIISAIAAVVRRFERIANRIVAFTFLVVMFTWPWTVSGGLWTETARPWPWFLITVATATAAVGWKPRWAAVYLFVAPALYAFIRSSPFGGSAPVALAALDALYAVLLGGALLVIIVLLRTAASEVDNSQAEALERYTVAVRQHAAEVERLQVDSLVHDSVLTAFLQAAKADTPESQRSAAELAQRSIDHVREAVQEMPHGGAVIELEAVADELMRDSGVELGEFSIVREPLGEAVIPEMVADALISASTQAMVNSLRHAGEAARRWVQVAPLGSGGIKIAVGDDGCGFNLDEIPAERMGVRVSIQERVQGVGGEVSIESAPGQGTIVTLTWLPDEVAQ